MQDLELLHDSPPGKKNSAHYTFKVEILCFLLSCSVNNRGYPIFEKLQQRVFDFQVFNIYKISISFI